jgi:hypothetical protein
MSKTFNSNPRRLLQQQQYSQRQTHTTTKSNKQHNFSRVTQLV